MSAAPPSPLPSQLPPPDLGEVVIWWATIDADESALTRARASVDAATLERAGRMRRGEDQRRILLAHALLRRLLGAITGVPPSALVLRRSCASCGSSEHGRPYLPGGPSFGLSHGGDVVAVAISDPAASVAIDVERIQPERRWEAVRRAAFSDNEWAATAGDPAAERTQLWARKEAAVKATGYGLEIALTRVCLEPADDGPLLRVRFAPGEPAPPLGDWLAADVALAGDHRASVALRRGPAAPTIAAPIRADL